jgi:hypothetical protein
MRYTKQIKPFVRPCDSRFPGYLSYPYSPGEIAEDGQVEKERLLKNNGHAASQLKKIVWARSDAVQFDSPGGRPMEQGESEKESRFSRSVRTY